MSNKKWMRQVLVMVVVIAMAICANNVFAGQGPDGDYPPKPPIDDNGGPHGDNPFEKDDTNNDGRVSRDEFNGPADIFDKMDVNSDGYTQIHRQFFTRHSGAGYFTFFGEFPQPRAWLWP